MNIESEEGSLLVARTAGSKSGPRVTYSFTNPVNVLAVGKKEIILAEIEACERLLKFTKDVIERGLIEKEISVLRMALDLLT